MSIKPSEIAGQYNPPSEEFFLQMQENARQQEAEIRRLSRALDVALTDALHAIEKRDALLAAKELMGVAPTKQQALQWREQAYETCVSTATQVQRIAELAAAWGASKSDTLLKQALEALEYHTEQTRPIQRSIDTMAALRSALGIESGDKP